VFHVQDDCAWIVATYELYVKGHRRSSEEEKFSFFEKLASFLFVDSSFREGGVSALASLVNFNLEENLLQSSFGFGSSADRRRFYDGLIDALLSHGDVG